MKILYVARHNQPHSNDDEGAIAYALEGLGCEVVRAAEAAEPSRYAGRKFDLLLFHKWSDAAGIASVEARVKAFWYFDLVDWPDDPTLSRRCAARREWMAKIIPLVDVGFCTDGDWAARAMTNKLVWLPQGYDERLKPAPYLPDSKKGIDLLFVGATYRCGEARADFVEFLKTQYGDKFRHYPNGVYREQLAKLVSSARVVVAPDSPVSDRYWSNRVYLMAGLGAFLIHPYAADLYDQYGTAMAWYSGRPALKSMIDAYLDDRGTEAARVERAERGRVHTLALHTYRHRCERLLENVKERLR